MNKYFSLLLDLLGIPENNNYLEVLNIIEKNKDKNIQYFHQIAFAFQWYQDLLNKKISPEEFLQIGDIGSTIKPDIKKKDSISFLRSNPVLDKNSIYIFDSLAEWIVEESANIFYC